MMEKLMDQESGRREKGGKTLGEVSTISFKLKTKRK